MTAQPENQKNSPAPPADDPGPADSAQQWANAVLQQAIAHAEGESRARRERVATAVLSGLLASSPVKFERVGPNLVNYSPDADQVAALAIAYADALITRLNAPPAA